MTVDQSHALLEVEGLTKVFQGMTAVDHLSFKLNAGGITAMVGPNGAGKTTALSLIAGDLRATEGTVTFDGRSVTKNSSDDRARAGLARTFQFLLLFNELTVLENVLVALEGRGASHHRHNRREVAMDVLERTGLVECAGVLAEDLSYAEQKFLSLARIMALGPSLALLDEPGSGLDGPSLDRFVELIKSLPPSGTTVLIVEHNIDLVRDLADRVMFLHEGRLYADGEPEEIFSSKELGEIYFGSSVGSTE